MMLKAIKTFLTRAAISSALKRKAPNTIPLSGMDRLRGRNYFTVSLDDTENGDHFLVDDSILQGLEGLWFSGTGPGYKASLPNTFLSQMRLEIMHYAREVEISYSSPLTFYWSKWTFGASRSVWFLRFNIWRFSKKKLPREDRMEVLGWAYRYTMQSEDQHARFDPLSFLIERYGNFIIFHPEKGRLLKYHKLIFESLAASGDFLEVKSSWSFSLSPQALFTLDRYEEDDRRHSDNIRQQRVLGFLTFALVLVGVVQIIVAAFKN